MKRKILAIALSLALLSSLFVFATPVSATPSTDIEITIDRTAQIIYMDTFKFRGNTLIWTAKWETHYDVSGDWEGTCIFYGQGWRNEATGKTQFLGWVEFDLTGGTVSVVGIGRQTAGLGSGGFGNWTILHGTGDYASIHGGGKWGGETSAQWILTGQVHNDPN